ncbi:hypothetical protein [Kitasatospora sp. NPDC085879]|uniref:hypothetical protein n=1 Tax=Kitasatospora sp. NPDC085879 TaxID=3154769 RepID=UPI0034396E01
MTTTGDTTYPEDRAAAERTVREWAADGPRGRVLLLRGDRGAGRSSVLREALSGLPGVVTVDCAGRSVDAVAESALRALGVEPADARPRGTFRELVRRAAPVTGVVLLDAHLAGEFRGSAAPQAVLDHVVRHLVDRGPVAWAAVEADAALRVTRPSSTAVVELPPAADRPADPIDPVDPRAARSFDPRDLPELIGRPGFLAAAPRAELVDALPLAWPDGVPHNSLAADVHYLDQLGVRPAPAEHGEWLAALHHRLVCQGADALAAGLAEAAAEAGTPLPWRTVWGRWLPAGRSATTRPLPGPVEAARPALLDGRAVVVTRDLDVPDEDVDVGIVPARTEYVFDHTDGGLLGGPYRRTAEASDAPPVAAADSAGERLSWSDGRLRAAGRPAAPRFPFEVTGGFRSGGDLVLAGADGVFRVELLAPVDEEAPGWATEPFVELLTAEALRELPAEAAAPTADWLAAPFSGFWRPDADELPDGLVDTRAREFLSRVGVPLAAGRGTLWTGHLPEEGLEEWDVEETEDGGSRHLYRIGQWLGGDLLLDGSGGEVLLEDFDGDTAHAADSLPVFFAMLRLVCEPGRTVRQVNRRYAAAQTDRWLGTLDAEAAEGCWYPLLHEQHELDRGLWGDEK